MPDSFATGSRRPKRILFARSVDASNLNAQAQNVQGILRRWRTRDVRPSAFTFHEPDEEVAANPNVDLIRIAPDRLWRAKVFAAYMRFDAVFCPGIHHFADWAAVRFRRARNRPPYIVNTIEGLLGPEDDPSVDEDYARVAGHRTNSQKVPGPQWRRRECLLQMAQHIVAISPFLARQAEARYRGTITTLPLGVELRHFRPHDRPRNERSRVVCAANVRAHKRPEVFLTLASRFPQADFVWYGEGELRDGLTAKANAVGLSNLLFPGAVSSDELGRHFAAADIMLLPSLSEGVPKVTQEAAAAGLAQIVFGYFEAPSVVDGVNGFVVWDDDEMIERLAILLNDPERVAGMGRAGVRMAEGWAWDLLAPQWESAIAASIRMADASVATSAAIGSPSRLC